MSNDKSGENNGRILYQSEVFKDGPRAGANYSSSIGAEQGLEVFGDAQAPPRRRRPAKTHLEPAREIPVFAETDVLVVGGGPAGTAAAIAAARVGADVLLVERYNHLGGLSTGGLVIWIDRMSDWAGKHIIRGFASDIMDRLPKDAIQGPKQVDWGSKDAATAAYWAQRTAAFHGIVTWSPTVDPEALKTRIHADGEPRPRCACCCTPGPPRRSWKAMPSRAPSSRARRAARPSWPRWWSTPPATPISSPARRRAWTPTSTKATSTTA